ncbi:Ger(x)C family spore germination protein [Halocella sp. SP3-1]|uniref:Ger(x)C family spore germination protein n=1 Tax=Halocella sp. SP3-1 TaxID=2382161 RepID=UPI000F74C297|nr:Ger(x)C family spore germination protein [Halocella sp. SP3-1]AZO94975.1 Ger(x)C family spore germination protein [Halocella sp. SP3-1]
MIKKLICSLLIIIIMLSAGCANRKEVDELGIINLTAIDRDPKTNKYEIGVQLISPQGTMSEQGTQQQVWTIAATGDTLMKAAKNLRSRVPKKLVWFHSNIIVIGEELAKEGIDKTIDFFASNPEIRYNSWVLVYKGRLDELFKMAPRFDNSLAQAMEGIIDNQEEWSSFYTINLKDMLIRLANPHYDVIAGMMTDYVPKLPTEGTYEQENLLSNLDPDEKQILALSAMGVFKNGKLKGWFNQGDTMGYLWVTGEMKRGTIVVPVKKNDKDRSMSVDFLTASSKLKPVLKKGNLSIELKIKTDVEISEKVSQFDLTKIDNVKKAEKLIAEKIKEKIEGALKKAQKEYKADIFGYSVVVNRRYPKEWKEKYKDKWDEIYPNIVTNVDVEVTIKRLGMLSNPIIE